ncbi:MAG: hypothetical protein ICV62_05495 [Cyanobacteria bacterium Co-bin13]|nr:hypothetical protein [Cyanobacteria bacterium Co-bin13]
MTDFETALAAYQAHCEVSDTPCEEAVESLSQVVNGVVYLRSRPTGYVARYDVRRNQLVV